jgi:glycosyltransferase involved in cell wall biosynthesis
VIVAVKDNPTGLALTLQSLAAQGHVDLEVLVIDGGSQRATLEVLDRFPQLIDYRESGLDSGIADAFNRGISRAHGCYVAILNSGDRWTAETLSRVRSAVRELGEPDILYGHVRFVDAAGRSYVIRSDLSRHHQRAYLFHPCLFVRRDCYSRIGVYDTSYRLAMDSEWTHRAIARGAHFAPLNAVLADMELGGISDTAYVEALDEFRRSVVSHGLTTPLLAWVHYWRVRLGKGLRRLHLGDRQQAGSEPDR